MFVTYYNACISINSFLVKRNFATKGITVVISMTYVMWKWSVTCCVWKISVTCCFKKILFWCKKKGFIFSSVLVIGMLYDTKLKCNLMRLISIKRHLVTPYYLWQNRLYFMFTWQSKVIQNVKLQYCTTDITKALALSRELFFKGAMSPNTHARANENKLEKDGPTFSSCVGDFGRLFLSV